MTQPVLPGDKLDMECFVQYFMSHYPFSSPEVGIPYTRFAYGSPYLIKELKNSYQVTIKGITKRFSTLCYVGEFIYKKLFNINHCYIEDTPYKRVKELRLAKRAKITREFYASNIAAF